MILAEMLAIERRASERPTAAFRFGPVAPSVSISDA
jgi:hypothetical protein